ncbi:hypothetical protein OPQ81_002596 [Rhizoctonia solani]|nr:hypothetical protein OPQ81_002596 [Rhizoctonia solani]
MPGYTDTATKALVVYRRDQGEFFTDIAYDLNIDPSTASRIYTKYHNTKDFSSVGTKSGRPQKLEDRDVSTAALVLNRDPQSSAASIARNHFPNICAQTLQNYLHAHNIHPRVPRSVPLLSRKIIRLRYEWARQHITWTESDWRKGIFSDEAIFHRIKSHGRKFVWRRDGEALDPKYTKKTVKGGGGKISAWGAITPHGVGPLVLIQGMLTKEKYVAILSENLPKAIASLRICKRDIFFQCDNDPKHTSGLATEWHHTHGIPVLPWPSYSPDMNPIENVWAILDERVRKQRILPRNLEELWVAVKEEWDNFDIGIVKALYASMPNRVDELLERKGGNTSY